MPSQPTYVVTVAGQQVYFDDGTFQINEELNGTAKLRGVIRSEDGSYRPAADADVVVTENGNRIFGGRIEEPFERGMGDIGGRGILTAIDAQDYSILAWETNVDATFPEQTLLAHLQQLVPFIGSGVTLDPFQATGPTVKGFIGDNRMVGEILNVLAGESQWIWEIDYNKVLRMYPAGSNPAPHNVITGNGVLEQDLQVWRPGGAKKPNRVIVVAGGTPKLVDITQTFTSDGVTNAYVLDHQIAGWLPGGGTGAVAYGIVVINPPQFAGTPTESIGSPNVSLLWSYDHATKTISRNVGVLPAGVTVTITYQAQMPFTVVAEDTADIALNGVRAQRFQADTTYDRATAQALADQYLAQLSAVTAPSRVRFRTYALGFKVGQHLTIDVAVRAVNGVYTITAIDTVIIAGITVQRWITAVEGLLFRGSPTTQLGTGPLAAGPSGNSCCNCPAPPRYSVQYDGGGICSGAYHALYGPLFWDQPDAFLSEHKTSGFVFPAAMGQHTVIHGGIEYAPGGSQVPTGFVGLTDKNRCEMGILGSGDFSIDMFAALPVNPTVPGGSISGQIDATGGSVGGGGILINAISDIFMTVGTGIQHYPGLPASLRFTGFGRNGTSGYAGPLPQVLYDLFYDPAGIDFLPGEVGESYTALGGLNILGGLCASYTLVSTSPYVVNTTHPSESSEYFTFFANPGASVINLPTADFISPVNLRIWPNFSARVFAFVNNSGGNITINAFAGQDINGSSSITVAPLGAVIIQRYGIIGACGWRILSSFGTITGGGSSAAPGANKQVIFNDNGTENAVPQFTWDKILGQLRLEHIQSYSLLKLVNPFSPGFGGGPLTVDLPGDGPRLLFGFELSGGTFIAQQQFPVILGTKTTSGSYQGAWIEALVDETSGAVLSYGKGMGFAVNGPSGFAEIYPFGALPFSKHGALFKVWNTDQGPSGAAGAIAFGRRGTDFTNTVFDYLWSDASGVPRWGTAPPEYDGTPADDSGIPLIGVGGTPPFTLLTSDPASPPNNSWWATVEGASPTGHVDIKARILGTTFVVHSYTLPSGFP